MQEVRPSARHGRPITPVRSGRNPASFTSRARLGTDAITPSFVEVRPELHSLFTYGLRAHVSERTDFAVDSLFKISGSLGGQD